MEPWFRPNVLTSLKLTAKASLKIHQETHISHHGKRKIIDSKVPAGRGYVSSLESRPFASKASRILSFSHPVLSGACLPATRFWGVLFPIKSSCRIIKGVLWLIQCWMISSIKLSQDPVFSNSLKGGWAHQKTPKKLAISEINIKAVSLEENKFQSFFPSGEDGWKDPVWLLQELFLFFWGSKLFPTYPIWNECAPSKCIFTYIYTSPSLKPVGQFT